MSDTDRLVEIIDGLRTAAYFGLGWAVYQTIKVRPDVWDALRPMMPVKEILAGRLCNCAAVVAGVTSIDVSHTLTEPWVSR